MRKYTVPNIVKPVTGWLHNVYLEGMEKTVTAKKIFKTNKC